MPRPHHLKNINRHKRDVFPCIVNLWVTPAAYCESRMGCFFLTYTVTTVQVDLSIYKMCLFINSLFYPY